MHFQPHIQYFLSKLFRLENLDFLDMGIGIESRFRRCAPFWNRHLEKTKDLQRAIYSQLPDKSRIAVLGAGRCLDVDLDIFARKNHSVTFYDADSGCLPTWKKIRNKQDFELSWEVGDLSGSLTSWTKSLHEFLQVESIDELSHFLLELSLGEATILSEYDAVISLNILSQLPIYWRDRVQDLVLKYHGLDTDEYGKYEEVVQVALEDTYTKLQLQHLKLLSSSGAGVIGLIYDRSFQYTEFDSADWQKERALYFSEDSLELSGYHIRSMSDWYWDIAPQGIEHKDYSQVHEVRGITYKRVNPA